MDGDLASTRIKLTMYGAYLPRGNAWHDHRFQLDAQRFRHAIRWIAGGHELVNDGMYLVVRY